MEAFTVEETDKGLQAKGVIKI